jgi:hypothetical protein
MKPTLKQIDKMLRYNSMGLNLMEISKLMGMTHKRVHYYLHKYWDAVDIYGSRKARDRWEK